MVFRPVAALRASMEEREFWGGNSGEEAANCEVSGADSAIDISAKSA
jgi:hypothetical protein